MIMSDTPLSATLNTLNLICLGVPCPTGPPKPSL